MWSRSTVEGRGGVVMVNRGGEAGEVLSRLTEVAIGEGRCKVRGGIIKGNVVKVNMQWWGLWRGGVVKVHRGGEV